MADIRLIDIVLLRSHFEMRTADHGEASATAAADEAYEYPTGDFLELKAWSVAEDDTVALFAEASLVDDALPFTLEVTLGGRFALQDLPEVPPEALEKTLLWLCYPYLREVVSAITARSPLPPYFLPAITKLPHPTVGGAVPQPASE